MSFTVFPQQSTNDHSNWTHHAVQSSDVSDNNTGDSVLSTNQSKDTPQNNGEQLDSTERRAQANKVLNQRRSMEVNLDPALCQRLKQDSGDQQQQQQQQNDKDTVSATALSNHNSAIGSKGTKNQVNKLKSSFRQVASAPASPQQKPTSASNHVKSVKFSRFHLEKVCLFQGSHSPSQVPRSDDIKHAPFKVLYSQWPPIQHTLFQHQQNVQLKRSLKILDGGSTLHGQVLVRNLGYVKQVEIRYTLDGWQTVHNVMAEYRHSRGALDTFAYDIPIEQGMADRGQLRATVDLAVRYTVTINGNDMFTHRPRLYQHGAQETFWDNNDGHNYQIQVVEISGATPTTHTLASVPSGDDNNNNPSSLHYLDDPGPPFSMSSSSRSRYDFSQSLIKAKYKTKPARSIVNKKDTDNNNNNILSASDTPLLETQSAPSASPRSDFFHSSVESSSYSDLVKKYCFYGSQDTSSPSPALSING